MSDSSIKYLILKNKVNQDAIQIPVICVLATEEEQSDGTQKQYIYTDDLKIIGKAQIINPTNDTEADDANLQKSRSELPFRLEDKWEFDNDNWELISPDLKGSVTLNRWWRIDLKLRHRLKSDTPSMGASIGQLAYNPQGFRGRLSQLPQRMAGRYLRERWPALISMLLILSVFILPRLQRSQLLSMTPWSSINANVSEQLAGIPLVTPTVTGTPTVTPTPSKTPIPTETPTVTSIPRKTQLAAVPDVPTSFLSSEQVDVQAPSQPTILQPTATSTPEPYSDTRETLLQLDAELVDRVIKPQAAIVQIEGTYWKLVEAQFVSGTEKDETKGLILVEVLNEQKGRDTEQIVLQLTDDGAVFEDCISADKPGQDHACDLPLYTPGQRFTVRMGGGLPSESVAGLENGLPTNTNVLVDFKITFQRTTRTK